MLTSFFSEDVKERKRIIQNTREIIEYLAVEIGERTLYKYSNLERARRYINECFIQNGHTPIEEKYTVDGKEVANIVAEVRGFAQPDNIVIIGAHYDTVEGSPGADDNASSIAGLLELYRLLSRHTFKKTVRFVAFTLEEPPYFSTDQMGSWVHAAGCRDRNENIELMICLEMLGYGSKRHKQNFPSESIRAKFPLKGDFLVVVSLPSSSQHNYLWKRIYNQHAKHKIHDLIGPASIPGVTFSDHYCFTKIGYPGIMLTDTAFYRNQNYHTPDDTFETINFKFLTENIMNSFITLREILNMDALTK